MAATTTASGFPWYAWALLTVACWGVYGVCMHTGSTNMENKEHGRIMAFLWVGLAYFLTAVIAPDPHAAAQYYPAGYWLSLISVPEKDQFPGTGPEGNGISPAMESQAQWIRYLKSGGCTACHQLGTKATREIPSQLGEFATTAAGWERRIQSGQAGGR